MPNARFNIWENGGWTGLIYTSSKEDMSITDKMQICKFLGISSESAYFSASHEAIDSLQLPKKPWYANEEGRKYWLEAVESNSHSKAFRTLEDRETRIKRCK
jgi:hypothetical protein